MKETSIKQDRMSDLMRLAIHRIGSRNKLLGTTGIHLLLLHGHGCRQTGKLIGTTPHRQVANEALEILTNDGPFTCFGIDDVPRARNGDWLTGSDRQASTLFNKDGTEFRGGINAGVVVLKPSKSEMFGNRQKKCQSNKS